MTKPLPPHGTTARAKGRPSTGIKGCPCNPCRTAELAYDKRRRYLATTGRALTVPAAPIEAHLRRLFEAGAGWIQLRGLTGCGNATIAGILSGRTTRVRSATAQAILAVRPGQGIPARRYVPSTGSIRRVRALQAIGHTCKAIGATARLDHTVISRLLNGKADVVLPTTAGRVAAAYRELAARPGQNARARNRAAREGWHGPLAWDENIDNPAAEPEVDTTPEEPLGRDQLAQLRREEIIHLADGGEPEPEIARRLGMCPSYVHDLLRDLRAAA